MKCHSKKIASGKEFPISDCKSPIQNRESKSLNRKFPTTKPAFSLVEAVMGLIVLALVSSSVLVVINRCMASAADSTARSQAFEVARENMEKILASSSVKELNEYGSSDKYPDIEWQTTVESFYEPISSRMWIRAVCSAEYSDTEGELQIIELAHWLTSLSKRQLIQLIEQKREEQKRLAEQAERTQRGRRREAEFGQEPEATPEQEPESTPEQEPESTPEQEPESTPEQEPETEPDGSPPGWPDWMPPKPVWDSMTRGEQMKFLFSSLSW